MLPAEAPFPKIRKMTGHEITAEPWTKAACVSVSACYELFERIVKNNGLSPPTGLARLLSHSGHRLDGTLGGFSYPGFSQFHDPQFSQGLGSRTRVGREFP